MTRRTLAVLLLAGAVLLGVAGALLWAKETADAEERASIEVLEAGFADVLGVDRPAGDVDPDRTLSIALFGLGGVMLIASVIVLAMSLPPALDREHHPGR